MNALTAVITILTALVFLAAAGVKFAEHPTATNTRDALAIPAERYRLIGVAEVLGSIGALVGLAVRPIGIAALVGLVLVALGACAAQIKLRHPMSEARMAIIALVLAVAALALQVATA
jgi:hypothetical protein